MISRRHTFALAAGLPAAAAFAAQAASAATPAPTPMRCLRIWADPQGLSHFEDGVIDLEAGPNGDIKTGKLATTSVAFQETSPGGTFEWHNSPVRQLTITLRGTLEFTTRGGEKTMVRPGDVILSEDVTGGGHAWRLIGDDPWARVYIVLAKDVPVPFRVAT